jgi:hypothetical protein
VAIGRLSRAPRRIRAAATVAIATLDLAVSSPNRCTKTRRTRRRFAMVAAAGG